MQFIEKKNVQPEIQIFGLGKVSAKQTQFLSDWVAVCCKLDRPEQISLLILLLLWTKSNYSGLGECLDMNFFFHAFLVFRDKFYHSSLFMHCSRTVHAQFMGPTIILFKKIKMDLTVPFIHLKIILMQCFQFLIFNFNKNKLYENISEVKHKIVLNSVLCTHNTCTIF